MAYNLQTDGQAEHLNKMMIARLHQWLVEHQRHGDIDVQLLMYRYSAQAHRSTSIARLRLVLLHNHVAMKLRQSNNSMDGCEIHLADIKSRTPT